MLSLLIIGIVSLTFLILTLSTKGHKRIDYLIFLGLYLSPITFIVGYFFMDTTNLAQQPPIS